MLDNSPLVTICRDVRRPDPKLIANVTIIPPPAPTVD
jgi:hypothetical protein